MRSARIIGGRRCLLLAFRQVPQCEEVPGYRESLHGILHQVRVLEELSGRTAQAPYSGVQHFFHFRRGQVFFKWYGGTYRHVLRDFDHLFVQNERSKRYLAKIGISRVTVVGIPVLTVCCRFVRRPNICLWWSFQEQHDDFRGRKLLAAGRGFVY